MIAEAAEIAPTASRTRSTTTRAKPSRSDFGLTGVISWTPCSRKRDLTRRRDGQIRERRGTILRCDRVRVALARRHLCVAVAVGRLAGRDAVDRVAPVGSAGVPTPD